MVKPAKDIDTTCLHSLMEVKVQQSVAVELEYVCPERANRTSDNDDDDDDLQLAYLIQPLDVRRAAVEKFIKVFLL